MIKEWRLRLCMTQKEFAAYLDIPLQRIQHWEQGFRNPPEYVVLLIKRILSYEHPELFR